MSNVGGHLRTRLRLHLFFLAEWTGHTLPATFVYLLTTLNSLLTSPQKVAEKIAAHYDPKKTSNITLLNQDRTPEDVAKMKLNRWSKSSSVSVSVVNRSRTIILRRAHTTWNYIQLEWEKQTRIKLILQRQAAPERVDSSLATTINDIKRTWKNCNNNIPTLQCFRIFENNRTNGRTKGQCVLSVTSHVTWYPDSSFCRHYDTLIQNKTKNLYSKATPLLKGNSGETN